MWPPVPWKSDFTFKNGRVHLSNAILVNEKTEEFSPLTLLPSGIGPSFSTAKPENKLGGSYGQVTSNRIKISNNL